MHAARGRLAELVTPFATDGVELVREVRVGSIGGGILDAATAHETDLIVMVSHRPEIRDYRLGPNAAHVARHATCSVLVLRKFGPLPPKSAKRRRRPPQT